MLVFISRCIILIHKAQLFNGILHPWNEEGRKIKSSAWKEFFLSNRLLLPIVFFITFLIERKVIEYFIRFLFSRCFDSRVSLYGKLISSKTHFRVNLKDLKSPGVFYFVLYFLSILCEICSPEGIILFKTQTF